MSLDDRLSDAETLKTKVALSACASYEPLDVKSSVREIVDSLGGIEKFVKRGDSVLLKPNMLAPAKPEQAVTTHPAVVRSVAEMVMDAGGKPFIADSPSVKGFDKVARLSGLDALAKELGIPIFPLGDSVEYKQCDKKIYRVLEISQNALDADCVINLPKLKTHIMTRMTMGVKNIFGCVVGKRKPAWHLKAGIDRMFFARMLVELYDAISPALTIIDGIVAMEGDGPGTSGKPREFGVLGASPDAVALDRVMIELVGAKPGDIVTNEAAKEMGVGETDINNIEVTGGDLREMRVNNFVFPKKQMDIVPLPNFIRRLMTGHLTLRPKEVKEKCTLCNKCVDICPTFVISNLGDRLNINYDKCIRCFCCVEVCPEAAMKPYAPWLLRIIS